MIGNPVRVLIVSITMDRGGAETLIMNLYRSLDRTKVQFDFILHCDYKSAYEDEIESLGGRIYHLPDFRIYNEYSYRKQFRDFFKTHPEYHVIHSHVNNTASIFLDEANKCGLHTITHSHCTSNGKGPRAWIRDFYRRNLYKIAEYRFACSEEAGKWHFRNRAPFVVIKNGIDTERFIFNVQNRSDIRKELNIPENAFVLGHVGRFDSVKNHSFLLEIFKKYLIKHPDSYLVLVGNGSTQQNVKNAVKQNGLTDRVLFTGSRQDVNKLYSAFDAFVFPSLYEGLPLTLIEAQCSGLPCIISSHLTDEFEITDLIHRVPLSESADRWAEIIEYCINTPRKDYSKAVREEGYDIKATASKLQSFYQKLDSVKRITRISLSFDDGRHDNLEAINNICTPLHIPVTINVTSGYIDGTAPLMPTSKPALTYDELKELYNNPYVEIALHGDNHDNDIEEQKKCYEKLRRWIGFPEDTRLGFASPGCGDESLFYKTEDPFVQKVIYARSGDRIKNHTLLRTFTRKVSRVIHSTFLYEHAFCDCFLTADDYRSKLLFSVLVLNGTSFAQVKKLILSAVRKQKDLILCFHSIYNDKDKWSWSTERFKRLCYFLSELRDKEIIDICTTADSFEKKSLY